MTDYIKREDAIKALGEEPYVWSDTDVEIAEHAQWVSDVKAIEAVPSADVVGRKRGEWFDVGSLSCRCSNCGCKSPREYSFCPNCGSDNRGGKDDKNI